MTLTSQLGHHHRYIIVTRHQKPRAHVRLTSSEAVYTSHGHLLAGVGGQVEDADAEERDEDAGDDEVDSVEERLAAQREREGDLRLVTALGLVVRVVVDARARHDVPRAAVDVVAEVDLVLTFVPVQHHLHKHTPPLRSLRTLLRFHSNTLAVDILRAFYQLLSSKGGMASGTDAQMPAAPAAAAAWTRLQSNVMYSR